jgi:hypothetical protein
MKHNRLFLTTFYSIFFLIGFFTFKDYGIGIEEIFQRASSFYWIKFILDFTNFEQLKNLSNLKLLEVYNLNPELPKVTQNLAYGIAFDLPSGLIELLLNFDKFSDNIYLKHFLSFIVFLISAVCFSLLLIKRFSNFYVTFFGSLAYCFSPKIYGASFFDGKDLLFLSLFTITIYFYQKFENKKKLLSLIIFSLFAAFLTSSRPPGLMVPISFIFIYFFKVLSGDEIRKNLNTLLIFILSYLIFIYLHWPLFWDFFNYNLKEMYTYANVTFFFDGEFYKQRSLPISFIPKWILISTPLFILILFASGLLLALRRFFLRLISIKENIEKSYKFDFWRSKKEEADFLILLCFFQTIIIYLTFDEKLTASWRHFFFFHFFLVFYLSFFIHYICLFLKSLKIKIFLSIILLIFNLEIIYKLYIYHPFQYSYFNNLLSKNEKLKYERDTVHLSRLDAMRDIISNANENELIKIGNASASPLIDVLLMFPSEQIKKVQLIGNDNLETADYIYTNYIYEINTNYNKKYEIPINFKLYKSVEKDDTLIYSIYKKK